MRKGAVVAGAAVAVALLVVWLAGWFDGLVLQSLQIQRSLQEDLAGAIRQVKTGQPQAVALLVALCFGYGIAHAVGPGHGKLLLGGYALSNRVSLRRLAVFALASSLAQAAVAVGLVYAGVLVFSWTREQMTGMADRSLAVSSHLMIGAIGLYLAARGLRQITTPAKGGPHRHAEHEAEGHGHQGHGNMLQTQAGSAPEQPDQMQHGHVHDAHCGHAHAPTPAQIEALGGWRDGLMLTASVAARPCSGALLVLLLCWRIGNDAAGIAGAFAMGLGTAAITLVAALLGATLREGAWATGLDSVTLRRVAGGLGLAVGLVLVATSALLVRPFL